MADAPVVGIIMGSQSDWETMRHAAETLETLGVAHEVKIVSAHRTPDRMSAYAKQARDRGLKVIIAGAGGVVTDWHGNQITMASNGRILAVGAPEILTKALTLLADAG